MAKLSFSTKNRLKRDHLVFFTRHSDILAEHANIKMHPGTRPPPERDCVADQSQQAHANPKATRVPMPLQHPSLNSPSRPSRDAFRLQSPRLRASAVSLAGTQVLRKIYFFQNEPNFSQCLWAFLKNENPNKGIYIHCYPDCGLRLILGFA